MPLSPNSIKRIPRPAWAREFTVDVEITAETYGNIQTARKALEASVHESVVEYLTEPDLCFDDDNFPSTRDLTGDYYLGDEWYIHQSDTDAFHCSVMARCLGASPGERPVDDYLGLEVHLQWLPKTKSFDTWRNTDSSVI